ncbi:MAG: hypothetical protein RR710_08175 [Oscillospiraceae bacterium]
MIISKICINLCNLRTSATDAMRTLWKGNTTMKNDCKYFKTQLIRQTIYKAVPRFVIGLLIVLLWNKYINVDNFYSVVEMGFFVMGAFFAVLAWINYLRIDKIKILGFDIFQRERTKPRKNIHWMKDIVDYVDEPTPSFDKLSDDEQLITLLMTNVFTSVCFLVPSFIAMMI